MKETDAKDFNDIHREQGPDMVREQVDQAAQRLREAAPQDPPERVGASIYQFQTRSGEQTVLEARQFVFRPETEIPSRPWLYGEYELRKQVSATVGAPGVGKTHIIVAETLSKVTGRKLLHDNPRAGPIRCWYWAGEEDEDELQRRFAAAKRHYNIMDGDIGDRLFVGSGRQRNEKLVIAKRTRNGVELLTPVFENMVRQIRDNGIDSLTIDPFVKSHDIDENDNNAMNQVAEAWGDVATEGNCAVSLFHHPRKTPAGAGAGQVSVDDARGGGALIAAVRAGRTFNKMTPEEGRTAGVKTPSAYVRIEDGKMKNAPSTDARWLHLEPLTLANGDSVAVVTPWKWPNPFEGVSVAHLLDIQKRVQDGDYRASQQATNWAGKAVAAVLGLDVSQLRTIRTITATSWWFDAV